MSGGKSSQCKGRGGEREARDILNAVGFSARCHQIYEPLDVSCDFGDGKEVPGEVKRKKNGMGPAYEAFSNGARFFMHRSDRKEWLITFTMDEFVRRYGPELQITDKGLEAIEARYWPKDKPIPEGWVRHDGLDETHHGEYSTFITRSVAE